MVSGRSAAAHASPARRLGWGAEVFVVLFAVWLALNGTTGWIVGLGFSALGALAGATLAPGDPSPWRPWPALRFAALFLRESLRGGLDVAYRALHPRLPLAPHFIEYPLRLPAGPPRTLMVSVVILLPGSLSADIDLQRNVLLVHRLSEGAASGLEELESRVAALFGLEPS